MTQHRLGCGSQVLIFSPTNDLVDGVWSSAEALGQFGLVGAIEGLQDLRVPCGKLRCKALRDMARGALGYVCVELLGKSLANTGWVNGDAGSWEQQAHGIEHGLERTNDKGQGQIAGEFDM